MNTITVSLKGRKQLVNNLFETYEAKKKELFIKMLYNEKYQNQINVYSHTKNRRSNSNLYKLYKLKTMFSDEEYLSCTLRIA